MNAGAALGWRSGLTAGLALTVALLTAPETGRTTPSHPTAEDGEIWAIYADPGAAILTFGTPETDGDAITFSCARGEGRVHALYTLHELPTPRPAFHARWPVTVRLHSGSVRRRYRTTAALGELGGAVFDLRMSLADPLLRAFRGNYTIGDQYGEWPARSPAERAVITQFFAICAAR